MLLSADSQNSAQTQVTIETRLPVFRNWRQIEKTPTTIRGHNTVVPNRPPIIFGTLLNFGLWITLMMQNTHCSTPAAARRMKRHAGTGGGTISAELVRVAVSTIVGTGTAGVSAEDPEMTGGASLGRGDWGDSSGVIAGIGFTQRTANLV